MSNSEESSNKQTLETEKVNLAAEIKLLEAKRTKLAAGKELLEAEKIKLAAETKLLEAEKTLADAKDPELNELKRQKTLAEARKGAAKATTEALMARYIGEVTKGPYEGKVDYKDTAGKTEGALLAAKAVSTAAEKIANSLSNGHPTIAKLCVFESADFLRFPQLTAFRFRKELVKQAFAAAGVVDEEQAQAMEPMARAAAAPALVSVGLEAFSRILGFFKTDYTVGGIEAELEQSVLVSALSGALAKKEKEVYVPGTFLPPEAGGSINELVGELNELAKLRDTAKGLIQQHEAQLAGAEQDSSSEIIEELKDKLTRLDAAVDLFDSFTSELTKTSDDAKTSTLQDLALEVSVVSLLEGGCAVLLVQLDHSGGGYFIKKNLLTALGRMPLFYMGGATVSYLFLDGKTGKVLGGETVPLHGGFVRADSLHSALEQ